jgi:hypothetical protein
MAAVAVTVFDKEAIFIMASMFIGISLSILAFPCTFDHIILSFFTIPTANPGI